MILDSESFVRAETARRHETALAPRRLGRFGWNRKPLTAAAPVAVCGATA